MNRLIIFVFIILFGGCGIAKQFPVRESQLLRRAKRLYAKETQEMGNPILVIRSCDYSPDAYRKENPYLSIMINGGKMIDTSMLDTIIKPNAVMRYKSGVLSSLGYRVSYLGEKPKAWGKSRCLPYYFENVEFYFRDAKTGFFYMYNHEKQGRCADIGWIEFLLSFDKVYLFHGKYWGVKDNNYYYINKMKRTIPIQP